MDDPARSLEYLKEVEVAGQDIVRDRQEIIALDRRRAEAREGAQALSNQPPTSTFMSLGPILVKMRSEQAVQLLKKDIQQVDLEVNKLRSDLKVKVNHLRDLERQPPVPGLFLTPISTQSQD